MKIILLSGDKNTGKTTTFYRLYDLLTQNMKVKPKKERIPDRGNTDFQCKFTYKGKTTVLFSCGDIMHVVYHAVILHSEADYLVLAHSQGGAEMNRIKDAVDNCPQHTLIQKTACKKNAGQKAMDAANDADCKKIEAAIK